MIPLKDDNPTSNKPVITYFLIGSCILIFLIQLGSQSYKTGQLFYSYGLIPSVLMGHNQLPMDLYAVPAFLTIFTSMFMHGGFMHLIGNMLYMWIFADNIEDNLGPSRFLIFYLLAGVIPFGFFSQLIKIRALYVLGFWFILQFISTGGGVAYAAHIGGFVSGMILILFFNKKTKRKRKIIKGPWG